MNSKKVILVLVLVFVIVLSGAFVLYNKLGSTISADRLAVQQAPQETPVTDEVQESAEEESQEAAQAYNKAPDFKVYDADGNEVHLYDYLGKPIVLNFWASWCGPCQMEMPDFNEKYLELGDEVQFLMVNMTDGARETLETASAFVAGSGYSFPVFYDIDSEAAIAYGASALPTTYFIDKDGNGIAMASGAISAEILQQGIDLIK